MRIRGQISIKGIVQGVGFRPFVYKTAHELGMQGTVRNLGSEVLVLAQGTNFEPGHRGNGGTVQEGSPEGRSEGIHAKARLGIRRKEGHPQDIPEDQVEGTGPFTGAAPSQRELRVHTGRSAGQPEAAHGQEGPHRMEEGSPGP